MAEDTGLILEERKRKVLGFLKGSNWIYIIILIAILAATFYIRTVNVQHLKDVTTGNYTLGPDLDPFLALRWAKYIVEHNGIMENDAMRYVPLGYETRGELLLWPYSIVWVYNIFKVFDPSVSVEYAAIIHPVIFFLISLFFMFFFVRKVFENEGNAKSNIIALFSVLLFSILPPLLHRTVAGIPEKEAPGIAFIMMSLYFFVCMLKAKRIRKSMLFGILAGIATGMAGLFWGGYSLILLSISLAMLVSFFFSKISKKDIIGYAAWIITFTVILGLTTTHYGGLGGLFFSTTSGACYFMLIILIGDYILFNTNIKERLHKIKMPRQVVSFILISLLLLITALIFDRALIGHILSDISSNLLAPFAGDRFTLTVAENSRPYFSSWINNFGNSFFWMFIVSSVILVYEAVKSLKGKWWIVSAYAIFILSLVFSKYDPSSWLNGSNFTSQLIYVLGYIIFAVSLVIVFIKAYKEKEELNLDKSYLLMIALFFFGAISARSAIRLFIILAIPTPILVSFGTVKLIEYAKENQDEIGKYLMQAAAGVFIFLLIFSFSTAAPYIGAGVVPTFEQRIYGEAQYTIPNIYTVQWQKAMAWVRDSTPKEAVFSHWWDYGYWLQSIGERATVLDGGNAIVYWDHLLGRHVLTGQDESEALEFLKTHKATYLLIDSTDIGKYPAYASIGSDENYDRYSGMLPPFALNEKASKETRNETVYVYTGGIVNDADIIWKDQIIPEQSAVIAGFLLPIDKQNQTIKQPAMALSYQGKQINIPIKCVFIESENKKYTFDEGLDSCMYIMPVIESSRIVNMGAALYISEKSMKALWVKLYLFDESEAKGNETKSFELVHNEQDLFVSQLREANNLSVPDIVYYQSDIRGPIKIWQINYPDYIKENPDYLKTEFPNKALTTPRGI